ncbi:MAG: YihY family inner membrane protein [Oscillospiraceae bacterium]|nr:YihY family inner membrane protein [Oscillospiraceae bacterium]
MTKHRFAAIVRELIMTYSKARVSRYSAALAYYLTLTIFPLLICVYAMLNAFIDVEDMVSFLNEFLPSATSDMLADYLVYVGSNSSVAMITAAVVLLLTAAATAFRTIQNAMDQITHRGRFRGVFAMAFSFVFSLLLLVVVYFAIVVVVAGGWFTRLIEEYIPLLGFVDWWSWARFLLLLVIMMLIFWGLYRLTTERSCHMPMSTGALAAALAEVALSIIFSHFISVSTRYSLVYGSLASVMLMMLWLYFFSNVLIMGNAVNVAIYNTKNMQNNR